MRKILLISTTFFTLNTQAQITITTGLDTASMSSLLEGLGVDIYNMTINCDANAYGQFSGVSEVPIYNGLVFATGDASGMSGANTSTSSGNDNSMPGDADLTSMAGCPTFNACVLEFDAIPTGDTLFFNFAFGSEEYMEWVSSGFNDVFAIFISGNGFPVPTNIAVLPNDTIVSVLNVNANINPQYYIDNETIPGTYVSFDGFTTNIGVEVVVVPANPYHFKIAIADALDGAVDSGVMLEAFSFRSMMEAVSIEENTYKFALYPNPASDQFMVKFKDPTAHLTILNSVGQEVLKKINVANGESINLDGLAAGSYLVKITSNEKSGFQTLMIVK